MKLKDLLPKIVQWEDIPYAPDFVCQNCGKSGHSLHAEHKANLIGYVELQYGGIMAVF